MPMAAPRLCPRHGPFTGRECRACAKARPRRPDTDRPNARQRGYDREWDRVRSAHISRFPKCAVCGEPADDVDHIVPISEAPHRRLDPDNLQSLCRKHHNQKTKSQGRGAGQELSRGGPDRRGKASF